VKEKQKDLPQLPNLSNNNLETLFYVDQDEEGNYFYDLSDTIYVETEGMNPTYYVEYDVQSNDTLFSIAKKFYETYNLWWAVAITNNIDDPFQLGDMVGETIKILKKPVLGQMMSIIDKQ
jgi:LysM repeat protein